MTEKTIELCIPLLLPGITDGGDACLAMVEQQLESRKGVSRVHVKDDREPAHLCLHYDPDVISLKSVQQFAGRAGSDFSARYHHEQIPFTGMDAADAATTLASVLEDMPGMLHANVNYAAGLIFVAYDSTILDHAAVEKSIRGMGYTPLPAGDEPEDVLPIVVGGSQDSGAFAGARSARRPTPDLLPAWLRDQQALVLVALAGLFLLIGWLGETFFGLPPAVALTFYLLSYAAGGYDIARHAIPGLLKGNFDTDVLMLAAAAGAAVLGHWAEGAFLLFLFGLGHAGEHYALDRARDAVNALGELMPRTARVRRGDQIVEQGVEALSVGDTVVVRPGDRLPVDGQILSGRSAIDQSPITGESVPISKGPGDEVFAGTVNTEAALDIRVTRLAKDNTLNRVMQMVAEAQGQRSPTQQFTQRFTAKFVPAVLILVVLVTFLPPLFGWMPLADSFYRAMLLLVAASPCALAIGTPAAVLAGIAQAARKGVLIKGGAHLEKLGSLEVMAFDKTGTLTEGRFRLTDIVPLNGAAPDEILRTAAAVESGSNHPLALAVVRAAGQRGLELPRANGLANLSGRGVRSEIDGRQVLIGSLKLFHDADGYRPDESLARTVQSLEAAGKTTMTLGAAGEILGVLALSDRPRPGVRETMAELLRLGIGRLVMLSGDNETVARRIGAEVGVTDVRANLMPEEKLAGIRELQEEYGDIAMTGDGVNDAPALAAATVGIAMGGAGTAVALETADVALMADDLGRLPFAVGLSRASRRLIRQNLAISLGVIALLILTSVLGAIQLGGAVILHEGSTVLVVVNALRLLRYGD